MPSLVPLKTRQSKLCDLVIGSFLLFPWPFRWTPGRLPNFYVTCHIHIQIPVFWKYSTYWVFEELCVCVYATTLCKPLWHLFEGQNFYPWAWPSASRFKSYICMWVNVGSETHEMHHNFSVPSKTSHIYLSTDTMVESIWELVFFTHWTRNYILYEYWFEYCILQTKRRHQSIYNIVWWHNFPSSHMFANHRQVK